MPYRTRETLEAWLAEFADLGYPLSERLKVIPQDGSDGRDTGLIGLQLLGAETVTYIQPEPIGSATWTITFEARDDDVKLDAGRTLALANELAMVAALCTFLQTKAQAFLAAQLSVPTP
ncbi:hypothetical protein [Microbacterium radiodurans]|uniref:Protein-L-isoaspartate carboxylmethyltransferase n=1 Tax=Microbacterium radiodurans TaxID=661398 RepID=A0A5J5IS54_9MICO|nr:hypothetical protein [Microbacterium radiodurans]KAA9085291.1 hypothetical protein F6B42_12525 [Microbacterium radiodurans]